MKAILFIFVVILWNNIESVKIRATRRQWIEYVTTQSPLPVQTQYATWQYPNQKIPVYQDKQFVYNYVNPFGVRFNTYGTGRGNTAYSAYIKGQIPIGGQNIYQIWPGSGQWANKGQIDLPGYQQVNGGQIIYGNWPSSGQKAWWGTKVQIGQPGYQPANGGQIVYGNWPYSGQTAWWQNKGQNSQTEYQTWVDSHVPTTLLNNVVNGEHDLNLYLNRKENSEGGDIQNDKNINQDTKSTQFNNNAEKSGSLFSASGHVKSESPDLRFYSVDHNKLDVDEASLQEAASKVSTANLDNISTVDNFQYKDGENILTEDLKQNRADVTQSANSVTASDWNGGENVIDIRAGNEASAYPSTSPLTTVSDLTSVNGNTITGPVNQYKTGTESIVNGNPFSTDLKNSLVTNGINMADARLQNQLNISLPPNRNLYYLNQNNVNLQTKYPTPVNEQRMHGNNPVYPNVLPLNQQYMNGYNMPWNNLYQTNQLPLREKTSPGSNLNKPCLNPSINLQPGYDRFTKEIYNNVPPQNLDIGYGLPERSPFDIGSANGAYQSNFYKRYPFLNQIPRKDNYPLPDNKYRDPYQNNAGILRPNQAPSTDPYGGLFLESQNSEIPNNIGSLQQINSEIISRVRDGHSTSEASEKYVTDMIVDIATDLVKFPSHKCHGENVAKLLEGIKTIVEAMKSDCEKSH
ncbi:uncharacterized protein LOC125237252 [Leguminivora glycinivorella]|uniref:uncharacterized protein LOC125237252 n=1 Tax=Leguminivora glycinivorella TaxID=1035111 RepID=UPI002010456E|nr:uncharacterized protein LOC125237252 [Leguminivora glycinivorella]